jgi:hypothetical protein
VLLHSGRYADATRLCKTLQTCRHVHAVAENVATIDNNVANIDANAELDALSLWHLGIALHHAALNINGTAYRFHDAAEFSEQPIYGVLDDPTTVLSDPGVHKGAQMARELGARPFFVHACQPAVPDNIDRHDSSQPSFGARCG